VAILVVSSLAGFFTNNLKPVLGLDLEGGVSVILTAPPGTPSNVMQRALTNIRNRVDAFGVGEPDIALTGTTIQVQVPGLTKSSIETRPKTQYCLIGSAGKVYACGTTQAAAAAGLKVLEVKGIPNNICIEDKNGKQLKCYGSQTEADTALSSLTVAAQASPTPPPGPSGSPSGAASPAATTTPSASPSGVGPGTAPSAYCVTDGAGTQLACRPTQLEAKALQKTFKTRVKGSDYCIVDNGLAIANPTPSPTPSTVVTTPTPSPGKAKHATPTPSSQPSASPSPVVTKPSPFATLDRTHADLLPCGFKSKSDAQAALDAIPVTKETKVYCVVSSTKQVLGCYVSMDRALNKQRLTSQGHLLDIIGKTSRLEERPVLAVLPAGDPTPITCSKSDPDLATEQCNVVGALDKVEVVYPDPRRGAKVRLGPVVVDGSNIKKANAIYNPVSQSNSTPQWVVSFTMDSAGATAFAAASTLAYQYHTAGQSPQDQIAIAVDRSIISSPQVINPITNGQGEISGSFTQQSSSDLATILNAGALPVELTRKATQTVSPTLGKASLQEGIIAGLVGLGLLFLYLLFYYRLLGVVAWVGMAIWATLALALVSLAGGSLGYALTLAGVAGLVISLGVTADSYIVFFERLKDEVRNGKSPRSAVQPAFKRAFKTILAADLVTGIAAVVLYLTAISSVRGFALTLLVSTLLDLFVVYFFKRPTVFLIARNAKLVSLRGFGLESGVAARATDGSEA
jgi:protein-export membrane protein SecD